MPSWLLVWWPVQVKKGVPVWPLPSPVQSSMITTIHASPEYLNPVPWNYLFSCDFSPVLHHTWHMPNTHLKCQHLAQSLYWSHWSLKSETCKEDETNHSYNIATTSALSSQLEAVSKEEVSFCDENPGEGRKLSGHLCQHVFQQVAVFALLHLFPKRNSFCISDVVKLLLICVLSIKTNQPCDRLFAGENIPSKT